jgi:hypothetical protein
MTTKPVQPSQDKKNIKSYVYVLLALIAACLILYLVMCTGGSDDDNEVDEGPYEAYDLMYLTEEYVKGFLKSPGSAEFPPYREWSLIDNGQVVVISSYVDSQNSFGALLRTDFVARYSLPDVELIELRLGGEVMYRK